MARSRQASTTLPAHTLSLKGKNLIRLFAVCMMLSGMLAMLVRPAAASTEPERIDGNTYNGLEYGWSLSWDDSVWTDPYEEHVDGTEYVSIETVDDQPTATSRIVVTNLFDGDVDACVTGWEEMLRNSGSLRHIKPTELDSGIELADGAAEGAYTYDVKVDEELVDLVEYVQCQPFSDGTNLVLSLAVLPDEYEDALSLFTDLIDGISVDAADADGHSSDSANADETGDAETGSRPGADDSASADVPGGSGVDGNTYTGVNFDWSVEWDASVWKTEPDWEDNSAGNDYFEMLSTGLDAPVMAVNFETTVQYDGDVETCAGAERLVLEGDPDISDVAEANVDLPEVADDASVVAYTYTFDDGNGDPLEMIEVQECLVLDNDGALLEIRMTIIPRLYDEALPFFIDLTDAIDINLN